MTIGLRMDLLIKVIGSAAILGAGLIRPVLGQTPTPPAPKPAQAVAAAPTADSIEAINADYLKGLDALEVRRIERLAKLAESTQGEVSTQAYAALFQAALSGGHYQAAEPIAERLIKSGHPSPAVRYLAAVTNILAECDRGAYEETLTSIGQALKDGQKVDPEEKEVASFILPRDTRMSILETYYQKLVQAGQFKVGRTAFSLIADGAADPAVREFAAGRRARLEKIGTLAPDLSGTDLDKKPFRLADLKGKVVLIVFWASWCIPSGGEAEMLHQIDKVYHDKGLQIVGVNLDTLQEDHADPSTVMADVKRFLVEHNVPFPNLINGTGPADYAKAFGVTDIPANFLIGRHGTIMNVDVTPANIDAALKSALGEK
jgi:thiol-disulfide isomerase/thioredoxin